MSENDWIALLADYEKAYPQDAEVFKQWCLAGKLPTDWDAEVPVFRPEDGSMATRNASGKVLNAIARRVHNLIGGSADLTPSNKTYIDGAPDQSSEHPEGNNVRFGVREHAMGAVVNGMALHGGMIPYGGTFLIFSDYMRPAVRLSALMNTHSIFVFTHDSISVGEDGPSSSARGTTGRSQGHSQSDRAPPRRRQRDRSSLENSRRRERPCGARPDQAVSSHPSRRPGGLARRGVSGERTSCPTRKDSRTCC